MVDAAVAKRIGEYYTSMNKAADEYNKLLALSKKVRHCQSQYFRTKDSIALRASKAAEKELDDYLQGKEDKNKKQQLELYR